MQVEVIDFIDNADVYRDSELNTHIDFKRGIMTPTNRILKRITLNANGDHTFVYIG